MFEIGAKSVIEKILPVVDNFESALDAASDEEKETPFVQGIDKIYKHMMTTLEEIGVTPIDAVGKEFEDKFALSELVQFIYRSASRNNKPIDVYIPSKRMRTLFLEWLKKPND